MAEKASDGLAYGQFGHATYDHEESKWVFQRCRSENASLKPLGEPRTAVQATTELQVAIRGRNGTDDDFPGVRREKQIEALIRNHLELQHASGLLPELARQSEGIEDATQRHDPAKGNLMAFGSVTDELGGQFSTVVAFSSGPTGSDLHVVQVRDQRRGWADSQDEGIDVPTIGGQDHVWKGPGVPIQSMTFARPMQGSDYFLAVRLVTSVFIFRPLFRRESTRGSRLSLNLLCELDIGQSGGSPFADVAFNPWDVRQVAVIDQAGDWSIHEMQQDTRNQTKVVCRSSSPADDNGSVASQRDDGWARITWVASLNTVAVCNRHKLTLFNIDDSEPEKLQDVEIGLKGDIGWILDLKFLHAHPGYLVVLTSSHLLVVHVDPDDETNARLKLKIPHFRNAEDISLRLSLVENENDMFVCIRSSLSSVILNYRLVFSPESHVLFTEAAELDLSGTGDGCLENRLVDLDIRRAFLTEVSDAATAPNLASRCMADDVRFYQVSTLWKDLSIRQTLYFLNDGASRRLDLRPTSWESPFPQIAAKKARNDFIVNDDEELELSDCEVDEAEPISLHVQRLTAQSAPIPSNNWTLSYELIAQMLNEVDVSEVTDLNEVIEGAREALRNGDVDGMKGRTLRDFADGEVTVHNMDEASLQVAGLRLVHPSIQESQASMKTDEDRDESTARLELCAILFPEDLHLGDLTLPDELSSVLDDIKHDCVSSLPDDIPELTRLAREQLASRMAAEVALASQVLRLQKHQDEPESQSQPSSLPLRLGATPSSAGSSSVYFDAQSQRSALPTPSPSATPSVMTDSSHPTSVVAPEIARLSRYTTFTKPVPPPLPRSLKRVLDHWVPGQDPMKHDWLAKSRRLQRRDDEEAEGEELTEKERRRMQRRTERYVKRQRREAEESQRQQALNSQAPGIVSASQPSQARVKAESQRTQVEGGSSQTFGPSQLAASQVLPGRHGGRPPARKKRKSGF